MVTSEISPGRYPREFLVGVCRPVLQILTLFQTKKCNFPHPFSDQTSEIHTRFQTCPLGRNYVIITYSSNPFRIGTFLFLSYSFGIETMIHSYTPVVPPKTILDSRPKWAKCIPVSRLKLPKNPPRCGGTYLCSLYKGVPPPPPPRGNKENNFTRVLSKFIYTFLPSIIGIKLKYYSF